MDGDILKSHVWIAEYLKRTYTAPYILHLVKLVNGGLISTVLYAT
jgi:hypothetical protein